MNTMGLIGTGLMGGAMTTRLLAQGFTVQVYNRSPEKLQPLQAAGAQVATSPAALLHNMRSIILMLTDITAIEAVLFCDDNTQAALQGRTIIQMSTIAPAESRALAEKIQQAGGEYLEAPVLGSITEARNGELIIMVGSTQAQFETYTPILQTLASQLVRVGEVGAAATQKLALNHLIAGLTATFSLSLGLIRQAQLPVEPFMQVLRASALYAPTFDKKLPRMLSRDFTQPNFPTQHLLKDVRLIEQVAADAGLETAGVHALVEIVEKTLAHGLQDLDYSALYNAIHPATI